MNATEARLCLTFDGEATKGHSISVEDYAPSLLALARAIKEAQRQSDPNAKTADLHIRATKGGSFFVDMAVQVPGMLNEIMSVFNSNPATATLNASGLAALFTGAVKTVIKLRNRRIRKVDKFPETGLVKLTDPEGNSITCTEAEYQLIQDAGFRNALEAAFKPVTTKGIESMSLETEPNNADSGVKVTEANYDSLVVPDAVAQKFEPTTREVALTLESIVFKEGKKWKVNDGNGPFYASIQDVNFISRVESGEAIFTANDVIRVKLCTQQTRTRKGSLNIQNTIIEVLEHIPGPRQVPLPFDDGNQES